ncbi:MauE/DoxX family redox-associated membrane protein [Ferruginibacter sp.]
MINQVLEIYSMLLKNTKWIVTAINFLLILLFVYTGTSKLIEYQKFHEQLEAITFLKPFAGFISIALPAIEILAGLSISYKPTMRIGLWIAAILMTAFTIYVAAMLAGDKTKLPCSCGGVMKALTWRKHLWFNIIFTVLAFLNIYLTGIRKRE